MKTNTRQSLPHVARPAPTTYEGAPALPLTPLAQLQRAVASCLLWEDSFYESGEQIAERIRRLARDVPAVDVHRTAVIARTTWKLRHAPLWLAIALADGDATQRMVCERILHECIQRPDELTEALALYWKNGRTPIAACVKRGLATAFPKFNAYQLAKYNRDRTTSAITLRDVMFLVHPKPRDAEQAETWKQLVNGTLPAPDTWEVVLSAGADKRATWTRLLVEEKLGALALLRNLRNMREAGVDEHLIEHAIMRMDVSRVLPFRFLAAMQYAPTLEPTLENAMFRALHALPSLDGKTALVVDVSASMWQDKVSTQSELTRFDAAAALAILCREVCEDVAIYTFAEQANRIPPRRGMALRDALLAKKGGASYGGRALDLARADGYDRIIVLTDGEWHGAHSIGWSTAPAIQVAGDPGTARAYLINVAAYQHAVGSKRWTMIDGWSESIIDFIRASEQPTSEPAP